MHIRPRIFDSRLTRGERRVYGAVLAWFVVVTAAMLWPLYVPLSRVRPFVFGLPLSLAWLVALLVASFLVALALFYWEERRGAFDDEGER